MLRTQDLGEADRIITLFSANHGKIRAVAKGVRKTKSRHGSRLEPFSQVDLQLYAGRSLDVITQSESVNAYHRAIIRNYDLYTAACAVLELTDRIAEQPGMPDFAQYLLLHGAIHAFATAAHRPELILYSYMLRTMNYAGWRLAVGECAVCGEEGPHAAFQVQLGGSVCDSCRPPGCVFPSAEILGLIAALRDGVWKIADAAPEPAVKSSGSLIMAYVQWHVEQKVTSLQFVNSKLIS